MLDYVKEHVIVHVAAIVHRLVDLGVLYIVDLLVKMSAEDVVIVVHLLVVLIADRAVQEHVMAR